jgi:predicted TIM-barrel enzyme
VRDLFRYADGAIVGSAIKNSMAADERVVADRVKELMDAVRMI